MRKILASFLLFVVLVTTAPAAIVVEDLGNLAQNAITAFNSVRHTVQQTVQIAHEVQMIKNQLEQLAYDAANLTKSPLQTLTRLQILVARYEQILGETQGISFQLQTIGRDFFALYPLIGIEAISVGQQVQALGRMVQETRRASFTAMRAQAVQDHIREQQLRLQEAMLASEASAGHLAAQQNTNQMLGIVAANQLNMQQIYAASERLKAAQLMTETVVHEQAQLQAQAWMLGYATRPTSEGIGIPPFR